MFSLDTFRNPPDDYRGTDFWMLNDKLDDDELRRQLHSMRGQGVASVIARTYIGLKSDYPGADFKHKMRVIVETAREVGIRIFLQACYMPEAVLGLPPEFALANLMPLAGDEAQNAVREGRGRILATAGGYAYTAVNTGTFLDMLDREAVAFYLERSYGEMWREFADEFGKTCVSVWVDEPSYSPRGLPWSRSLPGAFRRQWGYDLEPEAEALFRDVPNCATVRYHYWRIVRELLEHSYFVQVRDWCHAHGLLFSGHLMMEETLGSQLLRAGATMPYYKYFDIPGIDVLTGETNWRFNPLPRRTPGVNFSQGLYSTPLQCASAANQAGRERVLAEMYGVTSENFGLREQKHMFDHFAALGINHRSVHGIFYSLRGRAKRAFPRTSATTSPTGSTTRCSPTTSRASATSSARAQPSAMWRCSIRCLPPPANGAAPAVPMAAVPMSSTAANTPSSTSRSSSSRPIAPSTCSTKAPSRCGARHAPATGRSPGSRSARPPTPRSLCRTSRRSPGVRLRSSSTSRSPADASSPSADCLRCSTAFPSLRLRSGSPSSKSCPATTTS